MTIAVTCSCGRFCQFPDAFAGKHTKCLACGSQLLVPAPQAVSPNSEPETYALARESSGSSGVTSELAASISDCPNCGKRIQAGVKFCPYCEARLSPKVRGRKKPSRRNRGMTRVAGVLKIAGGAVLLLLTFLLHMVATQINLTIGLGLAGVPLAQAADMGFAIPAGISVICLIAGWRVRQMGGLAKAIYIIGFTAILPGFGFLKGWDVVEEGWQEAFC